MAKNTIHIINGPNLNLLGKREPAIYGHQSFETYFKTLQTVFTRVSLQHFQSNCEGALLDYIHLVGFQDQGIVLNAGAYTHRSIALRDAISAITCPVIEVHISNIYKRESFRHQSHLSPVCKGIIIGLGFKGYELAIQSLL